MSDRTWVGHTLIGNVLHIVPRTKDDAERSGKVRSYCSRQIPRGTIVEYDGGTVPICRVCDRVRTALKEGEGG